MKFSAEDFAALRGKDSEGWEKAGGSPLTVSKPMGGGFRLDRSRREGRKTPGGGTNPKGGSSHTSRFGGEEATDLRGKQSPGGGREPRAARVVGFARANARREGRLRSAAHAVEGEDFVGENPRSASA